MHLCTCSRLTDRFFLSPQLQNSTVPTKQKPLLETSKLLSVKSKLFTKNVEVIEPGGFDQFCDDGRVPRSKIIKMVNTGKTPHAKQCGIQFTNEQLIARCRSSKEFRLRGDGAQRARMLSAIPPPPWESTQNNLEKYNTRMRSGFCHSGKGMWAHPFDSRCVTVTAGIMGQYRPGDLVLDFG